MSAAGAARRRDPGSAALPNPHNKACSRRASSAGLRTLSPFTMAPQKPIISSTKASSKPARNSVRDRVWPSDFFTVTRVGWWLSQGEGGEFKRHDRIVEEQRDALLVVGQRGHAQVRHVPQGLAVEQAHRALAA